MKQEGIEFKNVAGDMIYKFKIVNDGSFPTVTISKIVDGKKFYAERNSCVTSSPVYNKEEADEYDNLINSGVDPRSIVDKMPGKLERGRLMATEMEGTSYAVPKMPNAITQMWAEFKSNTRQTLDRKRIGERSYVLYHAKANGQKITFRSCFPGVIIPWYAKPLSATEKYVEPNHDAKTIFSDKVEDMPHGTLLAVRGSFLVADMKVSAKAYHTRNQGIIKNSETEDAFQQYSGDGMVFLEVNGNVQEIPLYPGEAVDVFPGYLLAFTEGVKLTMKSAGKKDLRNEENNDYVIRCRAGDKGGYVYTHSVKRKDFFTNFKEMIKKLIKEQLDK